MRRVLFVASTTKFYSGAEWSAFRLAVQIKDRFDVRFLLPDRGELFAECRRESIPTIVVPFVPPGSSALAFPGVLRFLVVNAVYSLRLFLSILLHRIRIVHVSEIYNLPALIVARLAGAKTVCHVRAGVVPSDVLKTIVQKAVNLLAHRIIYVSHSVKNLWDARPSSKSVVIHNIHPAIEKFDPQEFPPNAQDSFVVGMVSKICRQKGHHYLVEAAAKMREMGVKEFTCSIVGGLLEGHEEYYHLLTESIRSHGLEKQFTLHGMRRDVPRLLSQMHVFVHLPEYLDPFPTVVLEAMMMGKPVVCFDSGGIPEQVENGVSGILVPVGDVNRLAEELVALHKDPQRRKTIGENARRHILEKLKPADIAGKVSDLYDALLSE